MRTISNRLASSDTSGVTARRSGVPTLVIKGAAGNPDGVRVWGSDAKIPRGYATLGCTLLSVAGLLGWLLGCAVLTRPLMASSLLFAVIGMLNLKRKTLLATDQSSLAVSTWRGERWMDWGAVTEVIRVRRALQPRLVIRSVGATISLDLMAFQLADRDAITEEVIHRAGLDCTPSWLAPMKLIYRRRNALASGAGGSSLLLSAQPKGGAIDLSAGVPGTSVDVSGREQKGAKSQVTVNGLKLKPSKATMSDYPLTPSDAEDVKKALAALRKEGR